MPQRADLTPRLRWILLGLMSLLGLSCGVLIARCLAASAGAPPAVALSESQLRARAHDPQLLARGRALWGNCVGCHGLDGQGAQGPNLTDDYWLHGSTMRDLCRSISDGYPLQGMPSWRMTAGLGDDDVLALAVYVVSLRGHGPAGKARQGVLSPISY